MKFKFSLIVIIYFFLTAVLFWQIKHVLAQGGIAPLTFPITSPKTAPITSPILTPFPTTAPTPIPTPIFYQLTGRVDYRYQSMVLPAEKVTVEAENQTTREKFTTQTDRRGYFNLSVRSGLYIVKVSDDLNTSFMPPARFAWVRRNTNGIYFYGKLKQLPNKEFFVSGTVMYKNSRSIFPSPSVIVEAVNIKTLEKTTILTDNSGRYNLKLKTGSYRVSVKDSKGTPFVPKVRNISLDRDYKNISFTGNIKVEYLVQGQVNYWGQRGYQGAKGVKVEAINIYTSQKYEVSTDAYGRYNLKLAEGVYRLRVYDNKNTYFVPGFRHIGVYRNLSNISFFGFLKFW